MNRRSADAHDAAASPAAGFRGEKRVESLKLFGRKEIAQPVALGGKDTDFSEYCKSISFTSCAISYSTEPSHRMVC